MNNNNDTTEKKALSDSILAMKTEARAILASMTVEQALDYCYANERQYVYDCGKGGQRAFDCLIAILEDGTIKPAQLPDYGMYYALPNTKISNAGTNT